MNDEQYQNLLKEMQKLQARANMIYLTTVSKEADGILGEFKSNMSFLNLSKEEEGELLEIVKTLPKETQKNHLSETKIANEVGRILHWVKENGSFYEESAILTKIITMILAYEDPLGLIDYAQTFLIDETEDFSNEFELFKKTITQLYLKYHQGEENDE
ncbi:hypothetical protein [Sulfuricurvum sp.]|uniref:hypothetical protein n=1 Tax=Sulfuricurvum sp. TaxID=2025608 RepID=UPI003BB58EA3